MPFFGRKFAVASLAEKRVCLCNPLTGKRLDERDICFLGQGCSFSLIIKT